MTRTRTTPQTTPRPPARTASKTVGPPLQSPAITTTRTSKASHAGAAHPAAASHTANDAPRLDGFVAPSTNPQRADTPSDVASLRRRAVALEAKAIAASDIEAKIAAFQSAAEDWLEVASIEVVADADAAFRHGGAADNARRCASLIAELTSRAQATRAPTSDDKLWPAIAAALAGDLDGCAHALPPSLVPQTVSERLSRARVDGELLSLMRASNTLHAASASVEIEAVLDDVIGAMERMPEGAARFAAVAVDAVARTERLSDTARFRGRTIKTLSAVLERARELQGPSATTATLLLEAEALHMAGRHRRSRSILAEALGSATTDTARLDVAVARARHALDARKPREALAILRAAGDNVRFPEERVLLETACAALVRDAAQSPAELKGRRGSSHSGPSEMAHTLLLQARSMASKLPPSTSPSFVAMVDATRTELRGGRSVDIHAILHAMTLMPMARSERIASEHVLEAAAQHEGLRLASLAPLPLFAAPKRHGLSSLYPGDPLRQRIAGLELATAMASAMASASSPKRWIDDDKRQHLARSFVDIADALGVSTPTSGPQTREEIVQRLARLGFTERYGDLVLYAGDAPALRGSAVRVMPRHFAGVGDDIQSCEVTFGAYVAEHAEEISTQDHDSRFVPVATQMHIGALVFSGERWAGVAQGFDDTLARAAQALRTSTGARLVPTDLAEVRALISLGRGGDLKGATRAERLRDLRELHALQNVITQKAESLRRAGLLEAVHLEIGEENAAGKTTIGQMALDAIGDAGFLTRSFSPKAPTPAERAQHPIQRHIDNGPRPGEAVFSDRTMAGSYAYNDDADSTWLADMAKRRRAWDEELFAAGTAQVSIQVNPGRSPDGSAIDDYAAQTSVVMGKREARAAVARHLLQVLEARGLLDDDIRSGLRAAGASGPGYRDLESLHTGESAALRAEHFARTVSNAANTWTFIGSFDRHPSRVEILTTVVQKLDAFAERTQAMAREHAALFRDGQNAKPPADARARTVWSVLGDALAQTHGDTLSAQCDAVATRILDDGRIEAVLRLSHSASSANRQPRADILASARQVLASHGINDVVLMTYDPALA